MSESGKETAKMGEFNEFVNSKERELQRGKVVVSDGGRNGRWLLVGC